MKDNLPRIIYIMGMGRSGSTLLDVILSNNKRMLGAGEIKCFFRDGYMEENSCSCGKKPQICTAWAKVVSAFSDTVPQSLHHLISSIESHAGFFPLLLKLRSSKLLNKYEQVNRKLFTTLAGSEYDVIIDSSKYAGRALALFRAFPENVHVICLTRSPHGLISSFRKKNVEQPPKSFIWTFVYYIYTVLCFFCCKIILKKKYYALSYERLCSHPEKSIKEIEQWSSLDLSNSLLKLSLDAHLDVGHLITGNRLRKQGSIKLKRMDHDVPERAEKDNVLIFLMQRLRKLL